MKEAGGRSERGVGEGVGSGERGVGGQGAHLAGKQQQGALESCMRAPAGSRTGAAASPLPTAANTPTLLHPTRGSRTCCRHELGGKAQLAVGAGHRQRGDVAVHLVGGRRLLLPARMRAGVYACMSQRGQSRAGGQRWMQGEQGRAEAGSGWRPPLPHILAST